MNDFEHAPMIPGIPDPMIHRVLDEGHPGLFGGRGCPVRPLKVGIDQEIMAAYPSIDVASLRAFLGLWTASRAYLEAIVAGGSRYGLDLLPCGEVETWQRGEASRMLGLPPVQSLPKIGREFPPHVRARRIRDLNPVDTDLEGESLEFVLGLLALHPRAAEKLQGMAGIRVVAFKEGQNALAVVGQDGSLERFSLLKCLEKHPERVPSRRSSSRARRNAAKRREARVARRATRDGVSATA